MSLLIDLPPTATFDSYHLQAHPELPTPRENYPGYFDPDNKSLVDTHPKTQSERYVPYDASPGGSISSLGEDGDDPCSPSDEVHDNEETVEQINQSLAYPLSDRLDPFDTLPVPLDSFQEHLLRLHSHDFFIPRTAIDNHFGDGIITSEPCFQMLTPAGLRVTLARSALDRLSSGKYKDEQIRQSLVGAVNRYRSDAITATQNMTKAISSSHENEELLESLIDLEKLEKKINPSYLPSARATQLREQLRSMGGPLGIQSAQLSRSLVHFECLYGNYRQSYVWSDVDFLRGLDHVNGFFSSIWMMWRSLRERYSLVADEMKNILGATTTTMSVSFPPFLRQGSILKTCLSLSADGGPGITNIDRTELICQLTSLSILCANIVHNQLEHVQLQQSLDEIHDMVEGVQLNSFPNERIMWLLQNNLSVNTPQHLWRAAEHTWLFKHLSYNVQCMIRDWFLKFLTGQLLGRCFKLDAFYFSYAS